MEDKLTELEQKALTDGIDNEGLVHDYHVETEYRPCCGVGDCPDLQCLKVVADNGATDIETRILYRTLISLGWMPPLRKNAGVQCDVTTGACACGAWH